MNPLTRRLAQEHHALIRYDDGDYWRINRRGIVQGRKPMRAEVVHRLQVRGELVQVACQMWSENEIWRPAGRCE